MINLEFEGLNERILSKEPEVSAAVTSMDYKITCIFCHTGNQKISEYCSRPIMDLVSSTNDGVAETLEFKEFLFPNIFHYLASGQEPENICADVILENWGLVEEPYKAYYGIVPAGVLGELFSQFGNRLFNKNIRYYKGSTDVNQSMRKVLLEEPENFFYYNNGVKLLCKGIQKKIVYSTTNKIGQFYLEGISLVNGAQTTGTIGSLYPEHQEQLDKALVFIQLIDLADAEESYALQITRLSNSQNKIDSKDFAALDPEQERIKVELSFSGISYLYKAGSKVEDPKRQVSFDEAIVGLACFQDDLTFAATAKRNIGALTDDISKPPYRILFNSGTNSFTLKNSVEIVRCVEKFLDENGCNYQGRDRLALVHGNRFIEHLVIQKLKSMEGFASEIVDCDLLNEKTRSCCQEIVPKAICAMGETLPDAYPANIFKNIGRCRELLNAMDISDGFNN